MFNHIDHVVLYVHNLARARRFYHEVMGLPVLADHGDFVMVGIGRQWLGLHPSEAQGRDVGFGPLVYLNVEDISATLELLRGRGVSVHQETRDVPGSRTATIHDSEGNALGLYQKL